MKDLNISLLREKFVIHDPKSSSNGKKGVIALSNRIVITLIDAQGLFTEEFVVRAQNMHLCARFTGQIILNFRNNGPLLDRPLGFKWKDTWNSVVNDYEYAYNPDRWIAVYHKGKVIFADGTRHPFLDLIEKCDAENEGSYEDSIPLAEDAFKNMGKGFKIEYDGNVALVINYKKEHARCAIIHRGANKTTTFNFTATAPQDKTLNYAQCLNASAGFLEGMQLAFMVGMNTVKMQMRHIDRHSPEEKQTREAKKRLSVITAEINNLEATCDVRYRPEKPQFQQTIAEAEKVAAQTLTPKKR